MAVVAYNGLAWFVGGFDNTATRTTTVWSWNGTASAVTVVSAAFGGTAFQGAGMAVLRTQTGVNTLNSITMWLMGGDTGAFVNTIFFATLNVALASTFTPSGTGASTAEPWQNTTQNAGIT